MEGSSANKERNGPRVKDYFAVAEPMALEDVMLQYLIISHYSYKNINKIIIIIREKVITTLLKINENTVIEHKYFLSVSFSYLNKDTKNM